MSTTERNEADHVEDRADAAVHEPDSPAAGSRRSLLGAFTGCFALAASGLFLAEELVEEVEAAQHPVQRVQRREEQRRSNRRRQAHHRHKRRHHDKGKPRGGSFGSRGIEFRVEGARFRPSKIDFYRDHFTIDHGSSAVLEDSKTIEPGARATFQTKYSAAFLFDLT